MARLAIERGPALDLPRRFLLATPAWGMLAAALLCAHGATMLRSRWDPALLAATHAIALGVLGNAMFGSLLQFLPAAAGVRVRGNAIIGRLLHGLLNAGTMALVGGLYLAAPRLLSVAAVMLPASFVLLAAMVLPGLVRAGGQRLLRAGIGAALAAALVTVVLGAGLALLLAGHVATALSLPALADVHAAWGLAGWVLVLLASIARVVMPMFQGTGEVRASLQAGWLLGLGLLLVAGSLAWLGAGEPGLLRIGVALATLAFALAVAWLQWRSPRLRNAPLRGFWAAGAGVLALAAVLLWRGGPAVFTAGLLALGIGLPLLVTGMQLQIVPFLAWIDLQRRSVRGVRVPPVQRLLDNAIRWRVLHAFVLAGVLLGVATTWPRDGLARAAGVALLLAHALAWHAMHQPGRVAARVATGRVDAA
jgi:hypothetical protein